MDKSTATTAPEAVPVTVGIEPVGCCAWTEECVGETKVRAHKNSAIKRPIHITLCLLYIDQENERRGNNRDRTKPINPKPPRVKITNAIGTGSDSVLTGASVKARVFSGAGAVNVARRVFVGRIENCAAKVGSTVEVAGGTGVGGGSAICNVPGESTTSGEYTHPLLFGAP